MILRQGESTGKRVAKDTLGDLDWMIHGTDKDTARAARRAGRQDLIDAHRWCDRNPDGNEARKEIIAAELRRRTSTPKARKARKGGAR